MLITGIMFLALGACHAGTLPAAKLKNTGSVAAVEAMVQRIFTGALMSQGRDSFSSPFEFEMTSAAGGGPEGCKDVSDGSILPPPCFTVSDASKTFARGPEAS